MKACLNYAGAPKLQYGVLFAFDRVNDIVADMMQSQYLTEQSNSFYIQSVRLGRLRTKNARAFAVMESLNDNQVSGKELGISHLGRKVLFASRAGYVFLLLEVADFYISNHT